MFGILKSKKTYVTAFLTIVGAVAATLVGDASIADSIQLIVTAVLGATIRNGIK